MANGIFSNIPTYLNDIPTYLNDIQNKYSGSIEKQPDLSYQLISDSVCKKNDIGTNRAKYLSSWKSSINNLKKEYQNDIHTISTEINDISVIISTGSKLETEYRNDLNKTISHIKNKIKLYSDNQETIINNILKADISDPSKNTQPDNLYTTHINDIFIKYRELSQISYSFFSNREYKIYESENDEWLDCLLPITSQEEHCKNILKKINDISIKNKNNICLCESKKQKLNELKNKLLDLDNEINMIDSLGKK